MAVSFTYRIQLSFLKGNTAHHVFNESENRAVLSHMVLAIVTLFFDLFLIMYPFSGQLDSSLAPNGRKQATLLGHRLASECVTHVYSSDLIRAKEVRKLAR